MLNRDQSQEVGSGAVAVQSAGNVSIVQAGISYSEARQIALDVAKGTFYELTGLANEVASIRVEEITNQVIEKLTKEFPSGLQKAIDPDFQYALYIVQKEYARNGDKDLGGLLVDLLVDRSKQDQRDILQIVLNESLATAPKLTDSNLAALAVIFLMRYTRSPSIGNHQMLGDHLDKHLAPFISKLSRNNPGYQHLEFSGCGSISMGEHRLENIFGDAYQGQFMKGFDQIEVSNRSVGVGVDLRFFIRCLNDSMKIQVKANKKEDLLEILDQEKVSPGDQDKILELFNLGKMSDLEIKEKLISIRPYMTDVFEVWDHSPMKNFTLTSVGMAIGHANIKRLIGEFANLSIWIH